MDTLKQIAMTICLVCMISTILSMLLPSDKNEKAVKAVISLFVALSALLAIKNSASRVDFGDLFALVQKEKSSSVSRLDQSVLEQAAAFGAEAIEGRICKDIGLALSITPVEVKVYITVENSEYDIKRIVVTLSKNDMSFSERVYSYLLDHYSIAAEVIQEGS